MIISEIHLESCSQDNKHSIFWGFPISPHVWTYVYSVFFRNPSHILSSYCSPTGDSKTAFGWVAQQTAVNLHLPSVTFSKPWVGVWRVLKVVKIWLDRKWEGKIFFPSFFSNSDFLLVRMLEIFPYVCDILWLRSARVCPVLTKKTSGSEVLQFFFDSCLRCRFSKVTSFGPASKPFLKDRFFFLERDFRGFGEPNMSPKNRSFLKKGNDYLPTTIFHLTCLLFREVSLCFPFLKPLIHQAVKHFQTCWVSLSTSRRPAFHVGNA